MENKIDILLGLQFGDEGKGKLVDYLADNYHVIARFQGGPNAGHTIKEDGKKIVLHTLPSGVLRKKIGLIGKNVVVDPYTLYNEMKDVAQNFGIDIYQLVKLSYGANFILPTHKWLDKAAEEAKGDKKIGSTLKGISPTYMDKTGRNGLLLGLIGDIEKLHRQYKKLKEKHLNLLKTLPAVDFNLSEEEDKFFNSLQYLYDVEVVETSSWVHEQLAQGKKILAEGAQGTMLDIDWGTYPYVTSSNTCAAGVCTGLGVSPKLIGKVTGTVKAYTSRVGGGPFPTEQENEIGQLLRSIGNEYGSTTGRDRRCGWLDLPLLRYAIRLNGVDDVTVTKLDILDTFNKIPVCTHYEYRGETIYTWNPSIPLNDVTPHYRMYDGWESPTTDALTLAELPKKAQTYLFNVFEQRLGTSIRAVTNGPDRKNYISVTDQIASPAALVA